MAINFNGTTLATNIDAVVFNGTAVTKVMFNGAEVWAKAPSLAFTTAGSANWCNSFVASGNTFRIQNSNLITYTAATGFTGTSGYPCHSPAPYLITASGTIRLSTGNTGTLGIANGKWSGYISNSYYDMDTSTSDAGLKDMYISMCRYWENDGDTLS